MLKIVYVNKDNEIMFVTDSVEAIAEQFTLIKDYPDLMPIIVNSDDDIVIGSAFKHVFETELNGMLAFVHTPIN